MESPDIRAGMAMLIAALCAEGTSEIGNIRQIDRGYERIDERLRALGARIERVATEPLPCLGGGDSDPPDSPGHPGRAARRDARAARDHAAACATSFEEAGYGEVWTPALEYEEVLRTGDENAAGAGFRTFDEQGHVLALRSDMTIPIARVVATRYADAAEPLRLCYFAHAYRAVERGTGQQREFLQGGIELIGVDGAAGEAEVIALTLAALDERGAGAPPDRARRRRAVPDAARGRSTCPRRPLLERLALRDLVGLEQHRGRARPGERRPRPARAPARAARRARGARPSRSTALDGLRTLYAELESRGVADRVILDLGLVRMLGYYTGAVYEVYDPAVGFTLGGGGRYDDLIGRFGEPRPACGIALDVQRVHIAQAAEEADGSEASTIAVPRGALFGGTLDLLDTLGVDTAEVRSNDRKLLFEDAGIVTMRPSDVPTYVEHGAADIGITGKDVLLEQPEREVYELLDLGFGRCEMVVAARARRRRARRGAAPARARARGHQVPARGRASTSPAPAARPRSWR